MGPLAGVKIIEVGGIGPGPFCSMMLSDMGAEIVRVDRKDQVDMIEPRYNLMQRNRLAVGVDLKTVEGVEAILRMIEKADAVTEGFRPGVMEDFGLGPDVCLKRNPKLVYGRMTGWGQSGPLSRSAGHDINYIALTGALYSMGESDRKPAPPLNLVGDFGGGGLMLAFGVVCALYESQRSGRGQVVEAAMVDGVAALTTLSYGMRAAGMWTEKRQNNLLDGGAHFYDSYETKDSRYVCVGSIEPQFYSLLLKHTGLETDPDFAFQMDRSKWSVCKSKLAAVFKSKTRDEWCKIMEGTDVCFAPVLTLEEAPKHPHNVERRTFVEIDGVVQPSPTPRFSRTVPEIRKPPSAPGADTERVLAEWGFSQNEIRALKDNGAI
ncbi:MAG: CoA transferase [Desulfobacterota bacterium]|jgi:alpha-methylacyl-CoA racemase|nr:CoA transferase [Thermodesulfobacteriota bacterium]